MTVSQVEESKPKLLVEGWIPPPLGRDFTVIGKRLNRRDAPEKVSGKAKYAGDMDFPGMLHAVILRSTYPHAKVTSVDASKAEALPGVRAVISSANCPGWFTYWYAVPQPAFPETVTYVGQEVAAIAADDIDTARRAAELIHVEYEQIHAIFDAEAAMRPGATLVTVSDVPNPKDFETYGPVEPHVGNIFHGKPSIFKRGDVDEGFTQADVIIDRTYRTPFQHHGTIQTRVCIATWDGEVLTIFDSNQGAHLARKDLAISLGLPREKVRWVVKYQGGGFGSKASAQRYAHYAAKLSMMTKRPVRVELTRAEEFVSHPRRPAAMVHLRTGVKKDGTITAMWGKAVVNIGSGGGYLPFYSNIVDRPPALYKCQNAYFEQWGVHTNLQYSGPMRSPLDIVVCTTLESHVDELADAIGMDPLEFRLRNYTPYADQTAKTLYSSKKLDEALVRVAEAIDWKDARNNGSNKGGVRRRGTGLAGYIFGGVGFNPARAKAEVVVRSSGEVELHAGVVDIGSGSATALTMIAAEELGIEPDDIRTFYGDTETTPYAPSSHASRVIPEMGPAVLQAAADARRQLLDVVARANGLDLAVLRSADRLLYRSDEPDRGWTIPFREACRLLGPEGVVGKGSRAPAPSRNVAGAIKEPGKLSFATFGAAAVEVEVDTETGEITVLRAVAAHQFGKALNPKLCDSQIFGGVAMGLGYALLEEPILDKRTGITLNTDFHQYRMPTSMDVPVKVTPIHIEADDGFFAYSAKGGGEGTNTAIPAAVRNAVYDAAGIWIYDFPLTRERVLAALAEKRDMDDRTYSGRSLEGLPAEARR